MKRINYLKEITTVLRLQCKKISVAKLVMLIVLLASTQSMYAQVYFHNFGTTNITTKPYTGAPTTLDANLSSSSWTTTMSAFGGFSGNGGTGSASLSLAANTGTNSITLTFNVASGKKLSISSFNLWRQRSSTGPATISVYINTIQVGNNIAVPTTGATLGVTNVSNAISNLTGTITVQIFTSGSTGGTFRLDDFTLNGTVSGGTPTVSTTGTLAAVNTTYGSGSASPSSFNVSGVDMTAGITATAPTGYQVSLASGSGYSSSVTVGAAGTIASTPVYVRLSPTASVAASPYSGNVVLSSTGATSVNVATVSSTVSTKALTISGLTANNKLFDGTTTAALSGTPSLVGVVNSDVVTLGGTYVADFASSAVATGIAVSVTGYSISGAGSSNYTLTQPSFTADITSAPSPIILSALTASGTYGDAINYTITASETPTSFNATGLPTGLSINTSTGEISGTSSEVGSFNVSISATNAGGTGSATLVYTISPKNLTVTGSTADSKVYDRTTTATISGSTLVGIVGADVVTLSTAGTFATATVGTGIVVTSIQTLGGTDAATYTVTLPSSLTANITQKELTISGAAASNKLFDGTNTATLTGTLNGVISPDTVTLSLSGTFASSAVGTAIAVTSTSTIGGAQASNYSLTQPTLSANIVADTTLLRWNTFGNTGNETTEPSSSNNANITAATLNYTGSTVTPTTNSNRFGANNWAVGALSTTKYIQFTVTPNLGYSYTPTSFSFTWDFSTAGAKSVALRSSADGYTANLGSLTNMTSSTSAIKTITIAGLSGLTTATTFRLYGYDATSTGGTGGFDCAVSTNNVNLYGTTESTGPIPTISTTGSLSALSTTYGTASATSTFNVSGVDMTTGITVTAPTGFEVSGDSLTGFSNTATIGAAGTISSTPVYVRLSPAASVAGSPYSGNIVLSTTGGADVNIATVSSTVSSLTVTATGATASNKIYDGNATVTITGVSIASANGDTITVTGGGTFSDKNVGTAKSITANLSLSGTNAANYTLTQPTLTADITAKELTITNPVAQNKIFDNNIAALITGTLSGVISPEVVTLSGTGDFASSAVGNGIAVTSTSTIGGADAGNYTLTQPTGLTADITPAGLTPQTITFALSSPVTYGVAPIVLGGTTTSPLTVTYASSNPSVASISNDTLFVLSNGTVTITASQSGDGITYEPALNVDQTFVINKKELTIQNALGQNKVYDRTNTATFTGTLDGIVGSDVVTLNNVGTFAQTAIGTGLTITPSATLSGADAGKYTLTQPTGLLANITPKELTLLTSVAQNKIVDGTNTATITGTLTGVIAPDAVTVSLSATFASSTVGNGIAVTSTSILGGIDAGNYTLTQPTTLVANIYAQPTMVEDIMPQYIQGVNGTNNNRLPYVFRATINNLLPDSTYRYYNLADTVNAPIASSAGIVILPSASGSFTSVSTVTLATLGSYGTFTANSTGSYTGWFIMQTSGNARFIPGKEVNMKIYLNNGEGGSAVATTLISTNTAKIINLGTTSSTTLGSGLYGNSNGIAKNMVFAYDNMNGTGRPISGSYIESVGIAYATNTASFYRTNVQGVAGAYGMIIPNVNANGIQLIQQLDYATAALIGCGKDIDGIWAGGANTVNPITGTTAKVLTVTDAPLNTCCTPTISTTNTSICAAALPYSWNGQSITTAGTFTFSSTNAGGCDSVATLNLTVNQPTAYSIYTTICAAALPYSWNGQSLTVAGAYTNTQAGANGCDSVTTINLTVNQPTTSTTNTSICAAALPYSWNGQSLTATGTYTNTQVGANSCDSVATLNLTVNQPTTATENTTICDYLLPYSWNGQSLSAAGTYTDTQAGANGCDSVTTLNLTVNATSTGSETLSGSSPFSWNGSSYTATGIYTYTTTNAAGCDSVVTLNLTITASTATVNLVAFIQGYYNGAGMAAARYDNLMGSGSATPGNATDVDFVTVELHDALTPSTVVYTADGMLQTDGTLSVSYPGAAVGNSYYIALKHQNSVQLWSANPVTITSTTSYDFSTDLLQAYTDGSTDPMALLAAGVYGMYSGDINQDEYIDGSDYSVYELDVDNSTNLGLFSLPSDLNGDTYVDGSDYPLFDINSANSLYSQHP